jgi:putative ABC transport system permease protein
MYAQFHYLVKTDLGYNARDLVEFTAEPAIMNKVLMDRCKTVFANTRGVEAVGYHNIGKFSGRTQAGGKEFIASYERIDENYLPVVQAPVLAGRNFSVEFPSDADNAVLVNETFARQAGWKDPIGQTVDYMNLPGWGSRKRTVIGLVKDYHGESLKEKIKPVIFTMETQLPLGHFSARIRPANIPATLRAMDMAWHTLFPDHPFQYGFTEDLLQKNYET